MPLSFYQIREAFPKLEKYYGLLAGAGFSVSYATSGVLWGMVTEKINRKKLMVFACASWSLISFISGSTRSFAVFVLMRMLLGVPQAALLPPAYSFIQKYFPKNKISTANALMTAAPLLGQGLSGLSVLAISSVGWRACYQSMAIAGFLISILGFIVLKEPRI